MHGCSLIDFLDVWHLYIIRFLWRWLVCHFLSPWIHMHVRACSKWKNKGCKLMYRAAKYNSTLFGKYENWFKWIFLIHDWRHQNRILVGLWGCSWVTLESPRPFWETPWVVLEASPVWFSADLRVVLYWASPGLFWRCLAGSWGAFSAFQAFVFVLRWRYNWVCYFRCHWVEFSMVLGIGG